MNSSIRPEVLQHLIRMQALSRAGEALGESPVTASVTNSEWYKKEKIIAARRFTREALIAEYSSEFPYV